MGAGPKLKSTCPVKEFVVVSYQPCGKVIHSLTSRLWAPEEASRPAGYGRKLIALDMANEAGVCISQTVLSETGATFYRRLLNAPPSGGAKSGNTQGQQQGRSVRWSSHTMGSHTAKSDGGDISTRCYGQASRPEGQESKADRCVRRVRPLLKDGRSVCMCMQACVPVYLCVYFSS